MPPVAGEKPDLEAHFSISDEVNMSTAPLVDASIHAWGVSVWRLSPASHREGGMGRPSWSLRDGFGDGGLNRCAARSLKGEKDRSEPSEHQRPPIWLQSPLSKPMRSSSSRQLQLTNSPSPSPSISLSLSPLSPPSLATYPRNKALVEALDTATRPHGAERLAHRLAAVCRHLGLEDLERLSECRDLELQCVSSSPILL